MTSNKRLRIATAQLAVLKAQIKLIEAQLDLAVAQDGRRTKASVVKALR